MSTRKTTPTRVSRVSKCERYAAKHGIENDKEWEKYSRDRAI
jgi:hypothetical protein